MVATPTIPARMRSRIASIVRVGAIAFLIASNAAQAGVIHVRQAATGTNDGSSWADAFADLQGAIAGATSGDQIWVAAGTYKPTTGTDRTISFVLNKGVTWYGGFDGSETSLEQNAGLFDQTILTGDLAGDDQPGFVNYGENSYHIIRADNASGTATIHGFVVTGGNADGPYPHGHSGGFLTAGDYGAFEALDCLFLANRSDWGGVSWLRDESGRFVRCRFEQNESTGLGGAMAFDYSNADFRLCSFSGNTAATGGATDIYWSDVGLEACSFSGNTATQKGGAIYLSGLAFGSFDACSIVGNVASDGGGLVAFPSSFGGVTPPVPVRNCVIWDNQDATGSGPDAQIQGGAVYLTASCVQNWPIAPGPGNLNADPLFVDAKGPDGIYGTDDDDLRLQPSSPCIDSGNNFLAPLDKGDLDGDGDIVEPIPFDVDGAPRYWNAPTADTGYGVAPLMDMGAHEFHGDLCQPNLGYQGPGDVTLNVCGDDLTTAGSQASIQVAYADPNTPLLFFASAALNPTPVPEIGGTIVALPAITGFPVVLTANSIGMRETFLSGSTNPPVSVALQVVAVKGSGFEISNAVWVEIGL